MKKRILLLLLLPVLIVTAIAVTIQAEETLPVSGVTMVDYDGEETETSNPIADWDPNNYAYVKLYEDTTFANWEDSIRVDLNGKKLTVGGSGRLYAFDSANDEYDAAKCGTVTNTGSVDVVTDVTNPRNGNRYLAVTTDKTSTFHRLDIKIEFVTLSTGRVGIYYKAKYQCDEVLADTVHSYGVILSIYNMPGADFEDETNEINRATSLTNDGNFGDGTVATSGEVFNIMRTDQPLLINSRNGNMKIYANAYIRLNSETGPVIVGDVDNVGKTVEDQNFNGCAYSLRTVMEEFDRDYHLSYTKTEREAVESFWSAWKDRGMNWSFTNIGKQDSSDETVDNSDLDIDVSTKTARCPVCREQKTWTALTDDAAVTMQAGDHYYLSGPMTYEGTGDGFVLGPSSGTACLHLNGKNLTATQTTAIFGGSGTLNVMGNGNVTGTKGTTRYGNAVHINQRAGGCVNLYGGTYIKASVKLQSTVISAHFRGGTVNIYEGATVQSTGMVDIYIGSAQYSDSKVVFHGSSMPDGKIEIIDNYGNGKTNALEIIDGTVGTIDMAATATVKLSGKSVIGQIVMPEDARLTLGNMAQGASVGITAEGVFSYESENAQAYQEYFTPTNSYCVVAVKDNALSCIKEYAKELTLENGAAPCLVCEKEVQWQLLVAGEKLTDGGHYYLDGDVTSQVQAPDIGTACLHLNGHDLTVTAAQAILGSGSTLNVMGTGTVTGNTAVQIDTAVAGGAVNLYSGTYQSAANGDAYTVNIGSNGGAVNIYETAKILGAKAICASAAQARDSHLGVYGAVIEGDIYLPGADQSKGYTFSAEFDNGEVKGTVRIDGSNDVTLVHAPVIELLDLGRYTRLTLDRLVEGANITVRADGKVTEAHDKASVYAGYFHPVNKAATISVAENVIVCTTDYESNLTGTTAYCPVCEADKTWTALAADTTIADGGHYYLTGTFTSQIVAPADAGTSACLHLNGNNVTVSNGVAISGSGGTLNVMGTGTVAGYTSVANQGAAVNINNSTPTNAVNLYSGTYKKYTGTAESAAVISTRNRGTVNVYRQATIDNTDGLSVYVGKADTRNAEVNLYACTITGGNITMAGAENDTYASILNTVDLTIHGTVDIPAGGTASFGGKTVIDLLEIAQGVKVTFSDMQEGSSVAVSASGAFTEAFDEAADYVQYFSTPDTGYWVVARDHALFEAEKITADADSNDETVLDDLYDGRDAYHGEMHDHTASGGHSDGKNSLATWVQKMNELAIDFATIVDHRQSRHMYLSDWDNTIFIGGSEPAVPKITDSKASQATMHYNMIFADATKFEEVVKQFFEWENADYGIYYEYRSFTTAEFRQLIEAVRLNGGLFTHVHPKAKDNYIVSSDPLDYWFADETCLEITTGTEGNMCAKDNERAYRLWVDLLELGKRIWASAGSDKHDLPNVSALTTIYSSAKNAETYLGYMREGDFTAGSVGIRMSVGDVTMGGKGSFEEKRVIFSVGDMHVSNDTSHTYRVELYDDSGVLYESVLEDPTQTHYFAINADTDSKFYRVVVWDDTLGTRIAVGNPIWNEALLPAA